MKKINTEMNECPYCRRHDWKKGRLTLDKKYYRCSCGCVFDKKSNILVEGLNSLNEDFYIEKVVYHGTTKENTVKILNEGFNPYCFFAQDLYNSLDLYGEYVFAVKVKVLANNLNWEIRNKEWISPNKIVWLRRFKKDVIYEKSD